MKLAILLARFLATGGLAAAAPAYAATFASSVVATGLNNPRGLAFGHDGSLYMPSPASRKPAAQRSTSFGAADPIRST